MLNLSNILEDSTRRYPSNPAFIFKGGSISYTEINTAANKVANGLINLGIGPGDKVALSCLNLPQFPIIYFAILKAGAIIVPLSVLLKKDEIEYHLRDSDAKAYFCYTGTPEIAMGEMGYAAFKAVEACTEFILIMPEAGMPAAIEGTRTFGSFMIPQSGDFETYQSNGDDTCVIIYTSGACTSVFCASTTSSAVDSPAS